MIKFFRHIRKKLLTENKFNRYLLYATGEILLVVIGILIALAFNNWNEQKKAEQQIVEVINRLENDLLYNFKNATRTLNFYANQEKICLDVLFDNLEIEDYWNNDLISIVTANWSLAQPISENIDYLLDNQKASPNLYRPILSAVKILKYREFIMGSNWNRLNSTIQENIEKLTNKVSMIKLDSISMKERFEYMLGNNEYKKIVELYWIHSNDYSDMVSRYREQVMATLSTIKVVKDNYGYKELKALYESNEMSPFIQISCKGDLLNPEIKTLRRGYLIGNLSSDDIILKVQNDNKVSGIHTLKPNSFDYTKPEYAGIGGDYTTIVEQLDHEGNCIDKFSSVKNGYLIIE